MTIKRVRCVKNPHPKTETLRKLKARFLSSGAMIKFVIIAKVVLSAIFYMRRV